MQFFGVFMCERYSCLPQCLFMPPSWGQEVAGDVVFSGCPSVYSSHSFVHDGSRTPWGTFFKCGTNVHWDSIWLEFSGQKPRLLDPSFLWTWYIEKTRREFNFILKYELISLDGQRSASLWPHKTLFLFVKVFEILPKYLLQLTN